MLKRRSALVLFAALAAAATSLADTVHTKDRKRFEGRIVRETETEVAILTYRDGEVVIPKSEITRIARGRSKFDDYDKELEKTEIKSADDHARIAQWCKKTGLLSMARKHWEEAVRLDPDHEASRKALGHIKEGGRWWTEDEYYSAKGFVKEGGKWVSPDELRRQREARLAGQIKEAVKMNITFKPNAPKEQLEKWGEQVKFWSQVLWDMTGGAVYLAEVHITDQSDTGHCVVVNLDKLNIDDRGISGRALNGSRKFEVGGLCNAFVFVHEFMHAWASLPDHYGTKIECLMNSSERGSIFKWKFCDPCWAQVQATWKLPFRPEFVENEELPGPTSPGKHGRPKHYGEAPTTKVTIEDKP